MGLSYTETESQYNAQSNPVYRGDRGHVLFSNKNDFCVTHEISLLKSGLTAFVLSDVYEDQ